MTPSIRNDEYERYMEDTSTIQFLYNLGREGTTFQISQFDFNKWPNDSIASDWDGKYDPTKLTYKLPNEDISNLAAKSFVYEGENT